MEKFEIRITQGENAIKDLVEEKEIVPNTKTAT